MAHELDIGPVGRRWCCDGKDDQSRIQAISHPSVLVAPSHEGTYRRPLSRSGSYLVIAAAQQQEAGGRREPGGFNPSFEAFRGTVKAILPTHHLHLRSQRAISATAARG